jgi:queuine tRNA-ribosyltransferase
MQIVGESKISQARTGIIKTPHGEIATPAFMPVATYGVVKTLDIEDIKRLGASILLSNTFHLYLRPGLKVIEKVGGLHCFMNWSGPILTDSGGYQIFSLGSRQEKRAPLVYSKTDDKKKLTNKSKTISNFENDNFRIVLTADGAEFKDLKSGAKIFLTPEKVIEIQNILGSDIAMVLDVCPTYPVAYQTATEAVKLTTDWAKRAKVKNEKLKRKGLLFGIVQGSVFKDLRLESTRSLLDLDFDGYAIGGVSVGEPWREKIMVLRWVIPLLPKDKPRYLMGMGLPEEIIKAVKEGVDLFDCVLPTRNARHGVVYTWSSRFFQKVAKEDRISTLSKSELFSVFSRKIFRNFYQVIHITNKKYTNDFRPLDKYCQCLTCRYYTRAYLHHLFKVGEPLALRLATLHNLHFYLELFKGLRESITNGLF